MKKSLAVLLSVLLIIGTVISTGAFFVSAVEEDEDLGNGNTYSVIGSSEKIFRSKFDVDDVTTEMAYDPKVRLYKLMLYDVNPEYDIMIQVVKNHSTNGLASGNTYITFDVVKKCDILVTFDATSGTTDVYGEGIRESIDAQSVTISGNCFRNYENNGNWNWQAKPVSMTQTSEGVWEYTVKNVFAREDYKVDFTAGRWYMGNEFSCSFGAEDEGVSPTGEEVDAVFSSYKGNGFTFCVPENGSDIHFKLDFTGFNFKYKSRNPKGAKLTITLIPPEESIGDIYGVKELYSKSEYFGESYSPELPMIYNAKTGLYELTVYDCQPKSDIDVVVVKNHYKILGNPDNNNEAFKFDVPEVCDVTITFDPATGKIGADFTPPDEPEGDIYTVQLVNYDFSASSGEVPMTYNEKTGLYEITAFDVYPYSDILIAVKKNHTETFGSPDVHYEPVYMDISGQCDLTVTFDPVNEIVKAGGECISMSNGNGIWSITAVGNGTGSFLNGDVFDNSNWLYYKTKGIWEVTYENVPSGDNYEVKFALNNEDELSDDTYYFGSAQTFEYEIGAESNVTFSNEPIRFRVPHDNSTVTFRLDLFDYNYQKNRNAKLTIIVEPYDSVTDAVYGVQFVNTGFYGTEEVPMTYNEDTGLYELSAENVEPQTFEFYVVKNHVHCYGDPYAGNNYPYSFEVTEICNVTITFDPYTEEIRVYGDSGHQAVDDTIYNVIVAGNGEGNYLNGAKWDPYDMSNAMTKVDRDGYIWELTMENIEAFNNYNFKFAANSYFEDGSPNVNAWYYNFGASDEIQCPLGEEIDAVYNGTNCVFTVPEDGSTVKLRLDLREYNHKTKQGAKFTITVTQPGNPVLPGDVNGDQIVDILDAVLIQKYSVDKVAFNTAQKNVADYNKDGNIDILDAVAIQKAAVN